MTGQILVVDDEPAICGLLKEILEDEGFRVDTAASASDAHSVIDSRTPNLILLDIWMPNTDGITLLRELSGRLRPKCPIVMMSGHGTVETAVEATRLGAYDFIEKPLSTAKLLLTVRRALESSTLQQENLMLRRGWPGEAAAGKSGAMQELRERLQRVAHHDTPVLLIGESGTDKELYARYLHSCSNRAGAPFVSCPVSSLGAATVDNAAGNRGERRRHFPELLAMARGGILFVKDIADLDRKRQSLLLETFGERAGAPRLIAATRRDLRKRVRQNKFQDNLYYRLNVVSIQIPPLREHREDIPQLLELYANLYAECDGLPYRHFTVAAQNRMRGHSWPGNLRELKNAVQSLLIMGKSERIEIEEVRKLLEQRSGEEGPGGFPAFDCPLREAREKFERAYLEHHLKKANYNISKAALEVGMERTHLHRKIKTLGLQTRH